MLVDLPRASQRSCLQWIATLLAELHLDVTASSVRTMLLMQPKLKLQPLHLIVEGSAILKVRHTRREGGGEDG